MAELGERLVKFHLLKDQAVMNFNRVRTNIKTIPGTEYQIRAFKWLPHGDDPTTGDICFHTRRFKKDGKVTDVPVDEYLCVYDVPLTTWKFEIGGIEQLNQWLSSRRYSKEPKKNHITRGITQDELKYFLRVINAINDTVAIIPLIDETYEQIEPDLLEIRV